MIEKSFKITKKEIYRYSITDIVELIKNDIKNSKRSCINIDNCTSEAYLITNELQEVPIHIDNSAINDFDYSGLLITLESETSNFKLSTSVI